MMLSIESRAAIPVVLIADVLCVICGMETIQCDAMIIQREVSKMELDISSRERILITATFALLYLSIYEFDVILTGHNLGCHAIDANRCDPREALTRVLV